VNKREIRKKIVFLSKQKQNIDKEIEKLQNQLVQELCPKEKKECEPAYCVLRITNSCPFLDEWRSIEKEIGDAARAVFAAF